MKPSSLLRIFVASCVAMTVIAGCGRTDLMGDEWDGDATADSPWVDTGADVPPDSWTDVPWDTWTDVPPDIWPDYPPDVPWDSWPDMPPDVWPDTWTDVPPDVPFDTRPDWWPDVPPDSPPDWWPDAPPDTRPDWWPDAPPDVPFDSRPDWWPDVTPDTGTDVPTDSTGGAVGDACTNASSCTGVPGSGRMCLTTVFGYLDFPGGYCSANCTSAAECGSAGACVSILFGSYCLESCWSSASCRTSEGYSCQSLFGSGSMYCLPPFPGGPDGGPVD